MLVLVMLWWWLFWLFLYKQGNELDLLAAAFESGYVTLLLMIAVILFRVAGMLIGLAWTNDERLKEYEEKKSRGLIVRGMRGNQSGEIK